jgi:hypothetical protein
MDKCFTKMNQKNKHVTWTSKIYQQDRTKNKWKQGQTNKTQQYKKKRMQHDQIAPSSSFPNVHKIYGGLKYQINE